LNPLLPGFTQGRLRGRQLVPRSSVGKLGRRFLVLPVAGHLGDFHRPVRRERANQVFVLSRGRFRERSAPFRGFVNLRGELPGCLPSLGIELSDPQGYVPVLLSIRFPEIPRTKGSLLVARRLSVL